MAKAPNLSDYLSFLHSVVEVPDYALPSSPVGTATGGDDGSLTDDTQSWEIGEWVGSLLVDITQGVTAEIAVNQTTVLAFTTTLANPIDAGDSYQIMPPIVEATFDMALSTVNPKLNQASPRIYTLAVYNLAADRLVNFAPDEAGQTWFKDLRGPKQLNLNTPSVGVVAGSSTESSSTSLLNPEQMKLFTLQDLQLLKTPWGRQYLAFAQAVGPLCGVS